MFDGIPSEKLTNYVHVYEGCLKSLSGDRNSVGAINAPSINSYIIVSMLQVKSRIDCEYASSPGQWIVEKSVSESANLLVMGSRGLGMLRRTLMGSVSDYVLHHAHCPVAVCHVPEEIDVYDDWTDWLTASGFS